MMHCFWKHTPILALSLDLLGLMHFLASLLIDRAEWLLATVSAPAFAEVKVVKLTDFARSCGAATATRKRAARSDCEREGGSTDATLLRNAANRWADSTWPKHVAAATHAQTGWCSAEALQVHRPTDLLSRAAKTRLEAKATVPAPKAKAKAKAKARTKVKPAPPCERPPLAVRASALLELYARA